VTYRCLMVTAPRIIDAVEEDDDIFGDNEDDQ
jgi:hypothetical protein